VFGIRPWEQRELLSGEELHGACDYIDRMNEAQKGE
jgi:hypothetical protein